MKRTHEDNDVKLMLIFAAVTFPAFLLAVYWTPVINQLTSWVL